MPREEQRQGGLADFAGLQFAGNLRQHGLTSARVSSGTMATARSAGVSASSDSSVSSDSSDPAEESVRSDSFVPFFLRTLFHILRLGGSCGVDGVPDCFCDCLYGFHIVSVYSGVVLLSPSVYRCKITMLVRWYADNRLLFLFPARRMR